MKKLSLVILFFGSISFSANWYVRPDGGTYGTANGTSWTNAWSGLASLSSVACGDTVWLAGGNYNGPLVVSGKNCSSSTRISFKKVLGSDTVAIAAAGWNASFDSQVVIANSNPGISIPNSNSIVIDGRANYGILVKTVAGGGDGAKAATSGSVSDIQFLHIEFLGPTCALKENCTTGAYGINFAPSTNAVTNLLVSGCAVHSVSEAFRASNWKDVVIERSDLYDIANDGVDHEDTVYFYPSTNVTLRYNKIHNVPNDGIFFEFGGAVNFYLYGNVFYASQLSFLTTKSPGSYGPMYIYNNTFHAPAANQYGWIQLNGVTSASEVRNNIFYNVSNGSGGATSTNNAYNYTTLNGYGWPSNEKGSFTFTGDGGLAGIASGDAHISASAIFKNKGFALAQDGFLNKDMDGNTRGGDGTWDIGAFEFATAQTTTLSAPKNLRVMP